MNKLTDSKYMGIRSMFSNRMRQLSSSLIHRSRALTDGAKRVHSQSDLRDANLVTCPRSRSPKVRDLISFEEQRSRRQAIREEISRGIMETNALIKACSPMTKSSRKTQVPRTLTTEQGPSTLRPEYRDDVWPSAKVDQVFPGGAGLEHSVATDRQVMFGKSIKSKDTKGVDPCPPSQSNALSKYSVHGQLPPPVGAERQTTARKNVFPVSNNCAGWISLKF